MSEFLDFYGTFLCESVGVHEVPWWLLMTAEETMEPCREKTCLRGFDQVRLKPVCSATEAS